MRDVGTINKSLGVTQGSELMLRAISSPQSVEMLVVFGPVRHDCSFFAGEVL
jgi:hypothetical protein